MINPGLSFDYSKLKRRNFIDEELFKRLESLKVPPEPTGHRCGVSSPRFARPDRRAAVAGRGPPISGRYRFGKADQADRQAAGDARVRHVLANQAGRPAADQLRRGRGTGLINTRPGSTRACTRIGPWDEVVKTLLTAVGDPANLEKGGPVNYSMDAVEANVQAEQTAQRFLGLRLRCAQCHDHPFDVWTQDAYYGLASFFAKVQRDGRRSDDGRTKIAINPEGKVIHLRTQKPVEPTFLDGKTVKVAAKEDPRKALADWMIAPDNPYFARAMANWVWAQFFSKGLVDPPDDMSRANPPVHPELLDALAKHFVAAKFDLRDLIRTIAKSETYGLSSGTVAGNERDTRLFSHHLPRPLTAHQMADALAQATDVPNRFPGVNADAAGDRSARSFVGELDPRHVRALFPGGYLRHGLRTRRLRSARRCS